MIIRAGQGIFSGALEALQGLHHGAKCRALSGSRADRDLETKLLCFFARPVRSRTIVQIDQHRSGCESTDKILGLFSADSIPSTNATSAPTPMGL
jgi:hypothetical protein